MGFPGAYDKTDNGRQLTSKLWRDFNPAAVAADPGRGWIIHEDYFRIGTAAEDYIGTQATTGTFALDPAAENGVALIDSASSTVTQGFQVQYTAINVTPAAGVTIAFETRLKVADVATGPEFYAGLGIADTTFIATSAVSATDWIGYYSITDDNILLFGIDDGTASLTTTPGTLVEGTYIKLGFKINGLDSIEMYVDGDEKASLAASVSMANIPDTIICPTFVCQSNGTTDPITHIDWWRMGVLTG